MVVVSRRVRWTRARAGERRRRESIGEDGEHDEGHDEENSEHVGENSDDEDLLTRLPASDPAS